CIKMSYLDFNDQSRLTKINSVQTEMKLLILNQNIQLLGFANDSLKPPQKTMPIKQTLLILLNALLNSQRNDFQISENNYLVLFKQNFGKIVTSYHYSLNSMQEELFTELLEQKNMNNI